MRHRVEGCAIEHAVTLEVSPSYLSPPPRMPLNGSLTDCHGALASSVLPRSTPRLVELGVAGVVAAFTAGLIDRVAPGGGVPIVLFPVRTGHALLTRFGRFCR